MRIEDVYEGCGGMMKKIGRKFNYKKYNGKYKKNKECKWEIRVKEG